MKNNPLYKIVAGIDNMTISKKTSLLFIVMVIGMLFIGSFSHIGLSRMINNFNILYTKRMLPATTLEKLKDIYSVNILDTLRDMQKNNITFKQGKDVILLAQDLIRDDWKEYKSSLKIDDDDALEKVLKSWGIFAKKDKNININNDEKITVDKIEQKIDYIDNILSDIFKLYELDEKESAYTMLENELYPTIYSINIDLTQLINLNLEASKDGKRNTDEVYNNTFEWIVIGTIGTISVAALIALIILQNIRFLHNNLENMVQEKTKELQELNRNLKLKIQEEVKKSREKDEIMFRQSRLAAMGEMVGNIAHQWRQPLNAISLIIQSFQMKRMLGIRLDDEFINSQVKEGAMLAQNMSKTIDDFRNFFSPNKKPEFFSIKENIQKSVEILNGYYMKNLIYINLVCKKDFEILGFPNEFSQVIVNLLSNSKDALNETNPDIKLIEVVIYCEEQKGFIKVIDNGGGIKKEVLDRIFEPYFTTKYKSSGTGIGLYMSEQIIEKQMEGELQAQNCSHHFEKEGLYKKCTQMQISLKLLEEDKNGL
ncbi:MAG: GHKL domain-containing protein [Epsilonproteobacteria bacterium]|nr:GHKL domain-containing protein [Campylobacterota bacterium]